MSKKPLVLLVNDDGVHAEGIKVLRDHFEPIADVYVCAPHVEKSAASHAISIHAPLRVEQLDERTFAVEGFPADCVKLAMSRLLPRKPDFILSGINRGPNLGYDTLYSGTVSAALEGALFGVSGIAVSSCGHDRNNMHYETAAKLAVHVFENMMDKLPKGTIYNLNSPSCDFEQLKGLKATTLGRRIEDDQIIEALDPRAKPYYWIGGGMGPVEKIDNSDCVEVKNGYASISVLEPSLFHKQATKAISDAVSEISQKYVGE